MSDKKDTTNKNEEMNLSTEKGRGIFGIPLLSEKEFYDSMTASHKPDLVESKARLLKKYNYWLNVEDIYKRKAKEGRLRMGLLEWFSSFNHETKGGIGRDISVIGAYKRDLRDRNPELNIIVAENQDLIAKIEVLKESVEAIRMEARKRNRPRNILIGLGILFTVALLAFATTPNEEELIDKTFKFIANDETCPFESDSRGVGFLFKAVMVSDSRYRNMGVFSMLESVDSDTVYSVGVFGRAIPYGLLELCYEQKEK